MWRAAAGKWRCGWPSAASLWTRSTSRPSRWRPGRRWPATAGVVDRVRWIVHDLDDGLPAACAGPYDLVVCQRFRDPLRYGELAAVLAPGGLLAVTVLSEVGAAPGSYRAGPGELPAAFGDLEVLAAREGDGEAVLVARAPLRSQAPPRGSRPAPRPPS